MSLVCVNTVLFPGPEVYIGKWPDVGYVDLGKVGMICVVFYSRLFPHYN